jgi:trk system potassium uptake protein TrkH
MLFGFFSATSTTGFGATTIVGGAEQVWTSAAILLMCLGMRTDGAASSTSWRKLIRGITLIEGTGGEIRDIFRKSRAFRYRKIDNRNISEEQAQREYTEATVIFILWKMSIAMGVAVLLRVLSHCCVSSPRLIRWNT